MDRIKKLGIFLEFERETSADAQAIRNNRQVLEKIMEKLGISSESLEELSYSDIIQT